MTKGRLEAFSDGVIAIILTIMVLELKAPHHADLAAFQELLPHLATYLMSFVYVAIYWNNHHHLLHTAHRVDGRILWANMHLLFWLSLTPFTTAWMAETEFAPLPVAVYGVEALLAGVAYLLLVRSLIARHGPDSLLARAVGKDRKGTLSALLYAAAVPIAFVAPLVAVALFIAVSILWLVPDRRIERVLAEHEAQAEPG